MDTIKREKLLHILESVSSGLATRENLEQSSCFVFRGGYVHTFNENIACRAKCVVPFEGAIQAKVFLELLRRLTEDELTFTVAKKRLKILGTRKKALILLEAEILLPIDDIEKPTEWQPLSESFVDAVSMVYHCADTNSDQHMLNCVHITPDFVEATDRVQYARIKCKTGFKKNFLVKRDAIKHIQHLGFTKCALSKQWIHFKNPLGLVFSCLRYVEDYMDLETLSSLRGEPVMVPKGISESVEKAVSFADGLEEDVFLTVHFVPNKIRIICRGSQGYYMESKKVRYTGREVSFRIAPKLLTEIATKYNDAEVNEKVLRAKLGNGVYMTALLPIKKKKKNGD